MQGAQDVVRLQGHCTGWLMRSRSAEWAGWRSLAVLAVIVVAGMTTGKPPNRRRPSGRSSGRRASPIW
jgi:hypothetical protein